MAKTAQFPGLDELSRMALRRLAVNWRESVARPRVSAEMALAWHDTIYDWVRDPEAPLLIQRGQRDRGRLLRHPTGRCVVITDDAPAHYILSLALEGRTATTKELLAALEQGRMPVARRLRFEEQEAATYSGTLATMDAPNLNELGYEVCHVTGVGVRRGLLEARTRVELLAHSLLLLSPVNMFLVPQAYAGVGEMPEFIEEVDDARTFAATA
jgi:hypothetical protein